MKVICVIQARLGSKRLPGKVLEPISGKPLIQHVVQRAQEIKGIDFVVLNVPATDEQAFRPHAFNSVYGVTDQEKDVLGSYLKIAQAERADVVMRITGDCPLLDPYLCADVLNMYRSLSNPFVYCANDTTRSGYPDGTDVEVFSEKALNLAAATAVDAFEREHVTVWLRRHLPNYGVLSCYGTDLSKRKWSVDTAEDLARVRRIYEQLNGEDLSWQATKKSEDSIV